MAAVQRNYIDNKSQINKNLTGLENLKQQLFSINLSKITKKAIYEVYAAGTAYDVFTGQANVLKTAERTAFHKHNALMVKEGGIGDILSEAVGNYKDFAGMMKAGFDADQESILVVECYLNNPIAAHQILKIVCETAPAAIKKAKAGLNPAPEARVRFHSKAL